MHYCIIGNGVAGTEAALAIRSQDSSSAVTIITQSVHHMYYRPRLIEYLAGDIKPENLYIYKPAMYDEKHIEVLFNTQVIDIDTKSKLILLHNGSKIKYDTLCIATGATPNIPNISGITLKGVFSIRTLEDADAIIHHIENTHHKQVAVVGGGLLGLETAYSLCKRGCHVTVIEFFDRLLPRQLDNEGASILKNLLEQKGLQFVLSDSVTEIVGDSSVQKVICKSGTQINADTVIFSMGIKPQIELAKNAGLAVNRGILINNYLQTSEPTIFAAGDPTEYNGICYGIWPAAREQGKLAGMNMAGVMQEYKGTLLSVLLKITGIDLYSAGDFNKEGTRSIVHKADSVYVKFLYSDTEPLAAIVIGDMNIIKLARNVMERKAEISELITKFA
ncbi:MAG: FAD-dependent oxidoreductase [Spirochaetes bacterium]|nr:FAD-dependent oxidoreductase [Spirochaetota bacterium]